MDPYAFPHRDVARAYCAIVALHNAEASPEVRDGLRIAGHAICTLMRETYGATTAGMLVSAGDESLPEDGRPACGGFYLDMEARA